MFSLIAAIGKNRELGSRGQLLFHIKEDLQFFKTTTMHHKIVMGRKTWDSLPGKLPGRTNIVVSRYPVEGADLSISDLPAFIAEYATSDEEIFVIGGGTIYTEFLPHAKHLYLTEIATTAPDADTFFPSFDRSQFSRQIIQKGKENDLDFIISKYTKK
ncbi:dihydrofolate reductase [Candidatus Saccharibacteria bacterium]|nr:dihydrofolate reductase [Candidatus Saccharibacteria bacterium]